MLSITAPQLTLSIFLMMSSTACARDVVTEQKTATGDSEIVTVGERPRAIEAGDINKDGRIDIIVANADADSISILFASEAGGYDRVDYSAGNEPSDVELIDLDDDGNLDIVVANHETSGVTILRGSSAGEFAEDPASPYDLGAQPHLHGLATGDFDGDGYVDIAADSSGRDAVAVLPGADDGFGMARSVPAGNFPYYRIDEVNMGDGAQSILVPSPESGEVRLIGGLETLIRVGTAPGVMMVVSADLDQDGDRDVAAIGGSFLRMWRASEDGFALQATHEFDNPTELAVGDIDGDGADEIAVSLWESETVYLFNSDGSKRGEIETCRRPAALNLTDLDGDGQAELVVGCWFEPEVRIFKNLP